MSAGLNSIAAIRLAMVMAMTMALMLDAAPSRAQGLSDPMRPPQFIAPSLEISAGGTQSGPVVQSILLSKGRRIATIDGKPMKIGDIIGDAKIVAIDSVSVTLREANSTRVLELYPGHKVPGENAAKARSSRKNSAKGTR